MLLQTLGKLGQTLVSAGVTATSETFSTLQEKLTPLPGQLEKLLEDANLKLTPIEVTITCVPTGPLPDDYRLEVDHEEFSAAINADRFVRPQITVIAKTDTLTREVLAADLIEKLQPILASYQNRVDRKHSEEQLQTLRTSLSAGFTIADFFLNMLLLCLIGAGALVGPIFWLLIGIGGIGALAQVPTLLLGTMKNIIFGTEIEQLEREVQQAHRIIIDMVRNMKITVDPSLS